MLSGPQLPRILAQLRSGRRSRAAPARRAASSPRHNEIPNPPIADRPSAARRRSSLGDSNKPAAERRADDTQRGYDVQDALMAVINQQARWPHSAVQPPPLPPPPCRVPPAPSPSPSFPPSASLSSQHAETSPAEYEAIVAELDDPPQHDCIAFGAYAPGCPHDCFLVSTEQPGVPHSHELQFLLGRQVCWVCGCVARRGTGRSECCLWRECSPGRPSCPSVRPLPTAAPYVVVQRWKRARSSLLAW